MYVVETHHFRPAYRKGDKEEETILVETRMFKYKKEARSHILWQTNGRKTNEYWKTGAGTSVVYAYTGKTWVNENSGETREECYIYKMKRK